MIILGCSPSAFSLDPNLLPTDLIYFYKIRVPDCINLDSDSDSDATDINELCDDLAKNPGVDVFYASPSKQTNDAIICVSSDEEVEVDQKWVQRVSRRPNSPVPLSMNAVQTSIEQLPMVVLPPTVRKTIEDAARRETICLEPAIIEDISEPAKEPVATKTVNLSNCFVVINPLSQKEIEKFQKVVNKQSEKSLSSRKKEKVLNIQEELKKLCDIDSDSNSDNIPLKFHKNNKNNNTELHCDMKSDTKMTIRRKSHDVRAKSPENDSNLANGQIAKKRKITARRHSVYESKSDSSKAKQVHTVKVNLPTRIVPKRRASMSNNTIYNPPEKQFKPDRAIVIEALPNKQLRQRSNYNEKSTNLIIPNEIAKIKTISAEKLKKDRNEKIRQVAENQCRMSVDEPSTSTKVKTITKPVAKMTMNNRGSFLTENIAKKIQRYAPSASKSISKTTIVTNAPQNSNSNDIKITIEQFRNSHLNADSTSTDIEGVCNNVQFYQNINIPNSETNKIHQRKLTITLDDEELEHQRKLQQSLSAGFYKEIPINPPTYSPTVAVKPFVQNVFNSSPIPSTSSKIPQTLDQTPKNKKIPLKSILTPIDATVKKDKRVSFNEILVRVREIPKVNQAESEDEESSREYYDVPSETIEPIEKILYEILSWCPSWLDNKRGEMNHPKSWKFKPMLQSYESLDQYKKILSPIMNMELLSKIISKYEAITSSSKHKWTTFKLTFCSKISASLFCIQLTGEIKENRKNYTVGSLIIIRITVNHKETKFLGYICEPIDRNNGFKVQCCIDNINYSLASTESKVDVLTIMYLRSELKSLMSLYQLTETDIMMKILKPESNKAVVEVEANREGILQLNSVQAEICCRIVQDLLKNKDAKVIALQGGPGTGKTKVIVAAVMKIIKRSNNCKILICSKSNTCINEITIHLNSLSIENRFRLVRFGNQERISKAVIQVSLNQLANDHLNKSSDNNNFHKAKMAVIHQADVVCTTINSSYDLINEYKKHFDVCFIDEASQFTDADLIIPVQSGFRKLVLIGDSKQLQPNVNAKELKNLNFDVSLLDRMNKICDTNSKRNPVLTLTIQHRMNSDILKFPNQYFYNNQLTSSLLYSSSIAVKPYMVFGLTYDQNMTQDTSSYNTGEIKFCYHLCEALLTILPPNLTIAIITPYLRQREEILKYFR